MSQIELLYGRKYQTPLFWNEPGENQVFGSKIFREAEKQVQVVREKNISRSRKIFYPILKIQSKFGLEIFKI
jgi:hypothetical protein